MNKELHDKVWAVLPQEFKEEVKEAYKTPYNSIHDGGYNHALEYFFGIDNLTSDTETEEMLIISRKAAEEFYNKYLGDALQAVNRITLRKDINTLFGGKCRVGEDDIAVNKTEPKFNVRDKVLISDDPRIGINFRGRIGTVAYINSTDQRTVDLGNGVFACFHISHLAPYTEPKQGSESAQNENKQPAVSDNQLRIMVAAEVMKGMLANTNIIMSCGDLEDNQEYITKHAVEYADALIKEINGKGGGDARNNN